LSGGKKNVGARGAFAGNPSVVVPTNRHRHHMSVQAAVTELLIDLEGGKAPLLFIQPRPVVVRYFADRTSSCTWQIMEQGPDAPRYYAALSSVYGGTPVGIPMQISGMPKRKVC